MEQTPGIAACCWDCKRVQVTFKDSSVSPISHVTVELQLRFCSAQELLRNMNDNINININIKQAVGGNIITASPISDLNPLLMSAGCILTVASAGTHLYSKFDSLCVCFNPLFELQTSRICRDVNILRLLPWNLRSRSRRRGDLHPSITNVRYWWFFPNHFSCLATQYIYTRK